MANTYVAIQTVTVGSGGVGSIAFTSIPQTYTDLIVKLSARGSYAGGGTANNYLTFNSSATSYNDVSLFGNGASISSFTQGTGTTTRIYAGSIQNDSWTANIFGDFECYIPNYATANYKPVSMDDATEYNATGARMYLQSGLWSNTAAITSITFTPELGTFLQYSTATLYGIKSS
jgi:hypothetical protein